MRPTTVPDHIVALINGGTDDDSDIQCLCQWHHEAKTREDLGQRARAEVRTDGWPVEP